MAGNAIISPQSNELLEKIIDGASLVYSSVELHSCEQLKRWLKCHGRSQQGKKSVLIERVNNALQNNIPVDPNVDKGKWLDILQKRDPNKNIPQIQINKYPQIWQPFPSQDVPKNFNFGSIYHYLVTSCIDKGNDESDNENYDSSNCPQVDFSTSKSLKRGKLYVDSGHVFDMPYKSKIDITKRRSYDPGRSLSKPVDKQKINCLLSDLQSINSNQKVPSMWQLLLQPQYDDYDLDKPRKSHLKTLVYRLTANMCNNNYGPIDITSGVQGENDKWWQFRKILITASKIKLFKAEKTNDQIFNLVKSHLWSNEKIMTEAMHYGQVNEEIARQKYENFTSKQFSCIVEDSGLWVNSKFPGLGASPDGLVTDPLKKTKGVLENKCPKILEKFKPTDLHVLTPQQRNSFCCTSVNHAMMKLKRTHQYYYQVQTQMAITERSWCDFVIWTPQGFHVEKIFYDKNFIEPILKHVSAFHQNILAPEYFEMRIPRRLIPFDLST